MKPISAPRPRAGEASHSIILSGIELQFGAAELAVPVLRGIDLTVGEGESLAVVGASGSGKSTLLMVMAGLEKPGSGTVRVAGEDITGYDEEALSAFRLRHLGIVFQSFHLMDTLTAQENVAMVLELKGERDPMAGAARILERVGLGHRLGHYPSQLSGGEQQRVAVARAFAPRPRILLADEPTGNLDSVNGQAIMDLLFGLQREEGTTLVLITHEAALAERCGRVVHMADGRLTGGATPPLVPAP